MHSFAALRLHFARESFHQCILRQQNTSIHPHGDICLKYSLRSFGTLAKALPNLMQVYGVQVCRGTCCIHKDTLPGLISACWQKKQ